MIRSELCSPRSRGLFVYVAFKLDAPPGACYQVRVKCPACDRKLTRLQIGPVLLDACQQGCGGIWFDAEELAKVNQAVPPGKTSAPQITCDPKSPVDDARERKCVHCRGVKLERKLFSLGSGVIMDCCPKCHGIWLDHGELDTIREELNPLPRPVRHVVTRHAPAKSIPINFNVVQQVQVLQVSKESKPASHRLR